MLQHNSHEVTVTKYVRQDLKRLKLKLKVVVTS